MGAFLLFPRVAFSLEQEVRNPESPSGKIFKQQVELVDSIANFGLQSLGINPGHFFYTRWSLFNEFAYLYVSRPDRLEVPSGLKTIENAPPVYLF